MGMILCPKHGRTGIRLVCPHLSVIEQGGSLPELVDLTFIDPEIAADFTITHPLCFECLSKYGLPKTTEVALEWGESFEKLSLEPVCGECFDEQRAIQQCNSPSST